MIKTEVLEDGRIRTWSDAGKMIIQDDTGLEYAEAVDIEGLHTYTESDKDIEVPVAPEQEPTEEEVEAEPTDVEEPAE